nr:hypothetical protein [Spirochaetia bacterium]
MMNANVEKAMRIRLDFNTLPPPAAFDPAYRRAPRREAMLSAEQEGLALRNALRYLPERFHEE